MIRVNSGKVEIKGSEVQLISEFMCLVCQMTDYMGEEKVRKGFEHALEVYNEHK